MGWTNGLTSRETSNLFLRPCLVISIVHKCSVCATNVTSSNREMFRSGGWTLLPADFFAILQTSKMKAFQPGVKWSTSCKWVEYPRLGIKSVLKSGISLLLLQQTECHQIERKRILFECIERSDDIVKVFQKAIQDCHCKFIVINTHSGRPQKKCWMTDLTSVGRNVLDIIQLYAVQIPKSTKLA